MIFSFSSSLFFTSVIYKKSYFQWHLDTKCWFSKSALEINVGFLMQNLSQRGYLIREICVNKWQEKGRFPTPSLCSCVVWYPQVQEVGQAYVRPNGPPPHAPIYYYSAERYLSVQCSAVILAGQNSSAVQCSAAHCSVVQHISVQCNVVQQSTM